MKDILNSRNIREVDSDPDSEYKFVRVGRNFIYGRGELHAALASLIPNIEYTRDALGELPVVDDAGLILVMGEKIIFAGFSSSCKLSGDDHEARILTRQIAREEFGMEVPD